MKKTTIMKANAKRKNVVTVEGKATVSFTGSKSCFSHSE